MQNNMLIITDDFIELLGFELLKEKATFCLYPGGIAIRPDWLDVDRVYYHKISINNNRKNHDHLLIDELKSRGLFGKTQFICVNNNHYLELIPHKKVY